jgi:hypothetical protein
MEAFCVHPVFSLPFLSKIKGLSLCFWRPSAVLALWDLTSSVIFSVIYSYGTEACLKIFFESKGSDGF